jgi:DnaJ-class molecular chaperone
LARQTRSRQHSLSFSAAPLSRAPAQVNRSEAARPVCGYHPALSWRNKSSYQCHYFSSSSSTGSDGGDGNDSNTTTKPNLLSGNPFAVLGVAVNSTFAVVRLAFVKLALEHHPDRDSGNAETFVIVRRAFEEIQQDQQNGGNGNGKDGSSSRRGSSSGADGVPFGWTEDELRAWYQEETGEDFATFTITESTRQEVIEVYKTMLRSGKAPKGGYWDYARQLTEREALRGKSGDDDGGGPMKLLGSDDSKSPSIGRRKRQRK